MFCYLQLQFHLQLHLINPRNQLYGKYKVQVHKYIDRRASIDAVAYVPAQAPQQQDFMRNREKHCLSSPTYQQVVTNKNRQPTQPLDDIQNPALHPLGIKTNAVSDTVTSPPSRSCTSMKSHTNALRQRYGLEDHVKLCAIYLNTIAQLCLSMLSLYQDLSFSADFKLCFSQTGAFSLVDDRASVQNLVLFVFV